MGSISSAFLHEYYDDYPRIEAAFQAALDESLHPRGPELLYEMVSELRLPAGAKVLDLGCGEGQHSVELAKRFGHEVHGIDPVPRHIELSNERLEKAAEQHPELSKLVRFELGAAETLPVGDATVELIWCREMLVHVDAIEKAFAECRRVLRSGGHMLIHDTFDTGRLVPANANPPGLSPARPNGGGLPQRIEAALPGAGFEIVQRIDLHSEWGEYAEEATGQGGRRLIHAARLLRAPDRFISQFGRTAYDIMLGDCLWHIYRMIGKLSGRVYLLQIAPS